MKKIKIIGFLIGSMALSLSLTSCDLSTDFFTDLFSTNKKDSKEDSKEEVSNEKFEDNIKLTVEKNEKPVFDGYSEIDNENGNGKYKFYYFNVAKADGVAISTAESYRYTGVDIDLEYTIEEQNENGVENSLEKATQSLVSNTYNSGYVITKGAQNSNTKTSNYTYERGTASSINSTFGESVTVGSEVEVDAFFAKAAIKAEATVAYEAGWGKQNSETSTTGWGNEFSKTNSVEKANSYESSNTKEETVGIANAYSTYKSSSYSKSKTVTIHLNGGLEKGWYRYALFSLCEVYYVLVIDTANRTAYYQYFSYPVKDSFYYGMQFSSDGKFNETIDRKVEIDLNDVVDYLNYEPKDDEKSNDTTNTQPNDSQNSNVTQYTVSFNSEGGSFVNSIKVNNNGTITLPNSPTRTGCIFDGWYTSYDYSTKFNTSTKITKNTTLYAKWILNSTYSLQQSSSNKIFNNGLSIYLTLTNNTGFDIYYLENFNMTIKNSSTKYICASASFGNVKPNGYIKKNAVIQNWDFFFDKTLCDYNYWVNNSFKYTCDTSYNCVVLPNELK